MRYIYTVLFPIFLAAPSTHAQTKVFNTVAQDMEQAFQTIFQDGKPVGYLIFTQLEKISADSFNYRIEILDENLKEIGGINFREEKLNIKAVSFEQNVLCLSYIRSNFVGKEYKSEKQWRHDRENYRAALFTQFLALGGKIIATSNIPIAITPDATASTTSYGGLIGNGRLKHSIQLRNISGIGFACFFGDENMNNLLVFSTAGKLTWQKQVRDDGPGFNLLISGTDVDLLVKLKDPMLEGGYEVLSYNAADSTTYPKFLLRDRKGNALKVLTFDNDPSTNKLFISGMIIDPKHGNHFSTGRNLVHNPYSGVFTIDIDGHTRTAIRATFSYWTDGSQTIVNKNGYFEEANAYANIERSFKDYQGNTNFAASGIVRKPRWVSIGFAVATLPTVILPALFMGAGTHKYASRDVLLIKQDTTGKLSLANIVHAKRSPYAQAGSPLYTYDTRAFYNINKPDTRSNYLVVDQQKDVEIYKVDQKKTARTIPHREGNNILTVFPAKEGYVMVYDFNKKSKTTRLSIEAL